MWENFLEPDRPQITIWCMRIACWITKATNSHSEYVIFIHIPLQQWLQERTSMLHYTYIAPPPLSLSPSYRFPLGAQKLCDVLSKFNVLPVFIIFAQKQSLILQAYLCAHFIMYLTCLIAEGVNSL